MNTGNPFNTLQNAFFRQNAGTHTHIHASYFVKSCSQILPHMDGNNNVLLSEKCAPLCLSSTGEPCGLLHMRVSVSGFYSCCRPHCLAKWNNAPSPSPPSQHTNPTIACALTLEIFSIRKLQNNFIIIIILQYLCYFVVVAILFFFFLCSSYFVLVVA